MQERRAVVSPELLCPSNQAAVARYLVVLDGLRSGDQRRIENGLVFNLAGYFFRFFENAVDGRTVDLLLLTSVQLEHFFKPRNLTLGLAQVRLKSLLEL